MKIYRPIETDLTAMLRHVPESHREQVRGRAEVLGGRVVAHLPEGAYELAPDRSQVTCTRWIGEGVRERVTFVDGEEVAWDL